MGLAFKMEKNNMTFLAHKLAHSPTKRKLIIVDTIHYNTSQNIKSEVVGVTMIFARSLIWVVCKTAKVPTPQIKQTKRRRNGNLNLNQQSN